MDTPTVIEVRFVTPTVIQVYQWGSGNFIGTMFKMNEDHDSVTAEYIVSPTRSTPYIEYGINWAIDTMLTASGIVVEEVEIIHTMHKE